MEIVFQTGELSDFPPIPKGFPTCGSWSPEDDDDSENYDGKGRKDEAAAIKETKMRKQSGR